jgi:flavin reductase (DIM6/NTAB) family NADH-FMN oxidoreductase RutF
MPMDRDAFDSIMASLDAPMAVVTTAVDGERAGCLIGFHAQSSIEPGRYCVWLSKANHTYQVALRAEHLAIHFLASKDHDLAELFGTLSGDDVDKFTRCDHRISSQGVPVLDRCPNWLIVERVALLDVGSDHVCIVTQPVEAGTGGAFTPLRLSDVDDLDPGHDAEEGQVADGPTDPA